MAELGRLSGPTASVAGIGGIVAVGVSVVISLASAFPVWSTSTRTQRLENLSGGLTPGLALALLVAVLALQFGPDRDRPRTASRFALQSAIFLAGVLVAGAALALWADVSRFSFQSIAETAPVYAITAIVMAPAGIVMWLVWPTLTRAEAAPGGLGSPTE